jgi:hypothetical protein
MPTGLVLKDEGDVCGHVFSPQMLYREPQAIARPEALG